MGLKRGAKNWADDGRRDPQDKMMLFTVLLFLEKKDAYNTKIFDFSDSEYSIKWLRSFSVENSSNEKKIE